MLKTVVIFVQAVSFYFNYKDLMLLFNGHLNTVWNKSSLYVAFFWKINRHLSEIVYIQIWIKITTACSSSLIDFGYPNVGSSNLLVSQLDCYFRLKLFSRSKIFITFTIMGYHSQCRLHHPIRTFLSFIRNLVLVFFQITLW